MIKLKRTRSKSGLILFCMFSIFFNFGSNDIVLAESLQSSPLKTPLVPLFDSAPNKLKHTHGTIDPGFRLYTSSFKRSVELDSTGGYIVIEETLLNDAFNLKYTIPLKEYIKSGQEHHLSVYWNDQATRYITGELRPQLRRSGGLEIQVPVKIKSKAFQQIFGGDRVSLTVTGNINIKGGFRHEDRSEVRTTLTQGNNFNFKMEQTQQFQVNGHVNEKVTVSVDQNSERAFDFENTIKLKYTGFEDEIVQSIEAGNISLSLPATRFVSLSGVNSGLFGIKTVSTLGNLNITSVMSQEKGKNEKLSISGGSTSEKSKIDDYNYIKNQYFFLDKIYRDNYWPMNSEGAHQYDADYEILEIEVYKSGPNYESQAQVVKGWAVNDSLMKKYMSGQGLTDADTLLTNTGNELYYGYFKRLDQSQYQINNFTGVLRLQNRLSDQEVLAIAYKIKSGNTIIGDLYYQRAPIILKLLKPQNQRPSSSTWKLMMKNIYSIGRNVPEEGFEATIYYKSSSGTDSETGTRRDTQQPASYLTIFGLDTKDRSGGAAPDNIIDNNANLLRLALGEIELPFHEPFDPESGASDVLLEDDKRCKFYNLINQNEILQESQFYFEVNSKMTSANYQLGFNVIEESEQVMLNGQPLTRGTDYIIDYMTGNLTILRDGATSPNANIDITYSKNEFFQLEKKTLIGVNAQYKFNEESFLGGTFLYMNQRTLDQKVRVGQGPMRNMIWDLNGRFAFKPYFLTKMIDALPLIQTKEESRLNFEGEIAQILPNPNTLNNEATGDFDGVAYIDDFEGASRTTPLGVIRRTWTQASCPEDSIVLDSDTRMAKKGHLNWYNPWEMVAITTIWPNREVNANVANSVNVLDFKFDPSTALDKSDLKSNWAGIMRPLSSGYANQSESKFIEIWLYSNRQAGKVHIDLGHISEDAIPNYSSNFLNYRPKLDTEDEEVSGIRNGLLDDGEDIGLDGMSGSADWYDLNGDKEQQPEYEPLSDDNWEYQEKSGDYARINGTENNANDTGGRYPDSEDINGNGSLDTRNEYFEYSFDLNSSIDSQTKQYVQGGEPTGWRLYRIPLADYERKIGDPSLDLIEFVRIWIDGVEEPIWVRFAEINIVGNQWLEKGVYEPATNDTLTHAFNYYGDRKDTVIVTVINTHDNPNEYDPSVTGVTGVRDRITLVTAKEQSLVLRINQTLPLGTEGVVQKTMPEKMDLLQYKHMKMFVHGGNGKTDASQTFPDGEVEYFIRFGSDEHNYYEYRSPVYLGWDKRNHMDIDLPELTSLKENDDEVEIFKMMVTENGSNIELEVREARTEDGHGVMRVVNSPALTNIRQITLGLKNISETAIGPAPGEDGGDSPIEVWFNELRLSEVNKEKGIAMRVRSELALADLLSVNAEYQYTEADFHRLDQRFGNQQNQTDLQYGGNLSINKFLPTEWGFSIPFSFNYSQSLGTPKYLASSDVLYDDVSEQRKEIEKSYTEQHGWNVSFRKSAKSNNFIIKNTLDKIDLSYGMRESSGHNTSMTKNEATTHTAKVGYRLDFGRRNFLQPFSWLGKGPIVRSLSEMKLYYTPEQISTSANGTLTRNLRLTRKKDDPFGPGFGQADSTFKLSEQIQGSYRLFESLTFSLNNSWDHDFFYKQAYDQDLKITDIAYGQFGTLYRESQAFTAKYNPNIVKWLTSNLSYSSNYNWNYQLSTPITGRSATNNTTIGGTFTLDPNKMITSIFRMSSAGSSPGRKLPVKPKDKDPEKETKDGPPKKEKSGPNIFVGALDFLTKRVKNINVSYNQRDNRSYFGLEDGDVAIPFRFSAMESPGLGIVEGTGKQNVANHNEDFSLRTQLPLIKNMTLSLNYKVAKDEQSGSTNTGGSSGNMFKGNPLPDWSLSWSGLEKFPLFNKFTTRVQLDHVYSGDKRDKWTNTKDNITNETTNMSFRPLIGLNMTLKKEITLRFDYNWTETINTNKKIATGGNKTLASDISVTAQYSQTSGFRVPLPIWPFKNKELKNKVNLAVKFSSSNSLNQISRTEGEWVDQNFTKKWEFRPKMDYSFSDRVNGGMSFAYGVNETTLMGKTTLKEFTIDVNISIRGN